MLDMGPQTCLLTPLGLMLHSLGEWKRFLPLSFRSFISLHVSCAHLLVGAQHQHVFAFTIVEPRHAPAQMDEGSGAVFKLLRLNRLDALS